MRILVVEDDKKTGAFIAKALKAEGFAVDVLRDGDDALAAIEITPFDAVLLDIYAVNLPGCEHFGFSFRTQPAATKYFWLDQSSQHVTTAPMSVPGPTLRLGDRSQQRLFLRSAHRIPADDADQFLHTLRASGVGDRFVNLVWTNTAAADPPGT